MTEEEEDAFEKFCRERGLPYDPTGVIDMTESLRQWHERWTSSAPNPGDKHGP